MRNAIILLSLIVIVALSFAFIDYGEVAENVDYYFNKNTAAKFSVDMEINEVDYESNYFYYENNLTESQKILYEYIAEAIAKYGDSITLYNYKTVDEETTLNDVKFALECFLLDHPEVFYIQNKFQIETKTFANEEVNELKLFYTISKAESKDQIKKINAQINYVYEANKDKSDLDIEIALYDILSTQIDYDSREEIPEDTHTIKGAFIDKLAVCDGYSKGMQVLLKKLGIDSIIVTGNLNGSLHAWNMVKINGNWYHVDVTSSRIANSYVSHAYLNLNTKDISKTHKFSDKYLIYNTPNTSLNYFEYKDIYIGRSENLKSALTEIINSQSQKSYLEFGADIVHSISEITTALYELNYKNLQNKNQIKIDYYQVFDSYIIIN